MYKEYMAVFQHPLEDKSQFKMPNGSLTIAYCVQSLGSKTWPDKMTNKDISDFLMMQSNN